MSDRTATDAPLWRPMPERVAQTQLTEFTRIAGERTGRVFGSYADLHRWSIESPGDFWQLVWDYTGVIAAQTPDEPVADLDRFPGTRWFPGARLNFAENLLRREDDHPALISIFESGDRHELTYAQLRAQVASLAAFLRTAGVAPGDRIAGWLPNTAEAVIAMLATASLGGVWSSCSPDFGTDGALDRFGQIEPKILFACDGYDYGGKRFAIGDKVQQIAEQVTAIKQVVWVEVIGQCPADALRFDALVQDQTHSITFVDRAFDDPLFILFSSGTTGKPKCIVHGIGGTLLQHLKEHRLHVDLRPDDVLFFFTTCGWMMWNWLVSGLASGSTLVLYDGSPFQPSPGALFEMAQQESVSIFGVSAKYLSSVEKADFKPAQEFELPALRTLLSTGSPLLHENYRFVYEHIKPNLHLASISGGTDLISCFVLGNPSAPVWEGEIQCAGLGMAVEVWSDTGERLSAGKGELVCTRPFPSCPIGFWDDPDQGKFLDAYFRRFPGVWAHGDFAECTPHGGFIIHGRSDAVLNPGGVRIGTAEIYRLVEQVPEVKEAVCVGQDWQGDTRIILFVVMQPGQSLDESIRRTITETIRRRASPRHKPAKIIEVADIPRTLSGKIVELAVRETIHNRPVRNTSALANPEALELYRNLTALQS